MWSNGSKRGSDQLHRSQTGWTCIEQTEEKRASADLAMSSANMALIRSNSVQPTKKVCLSQNIPISKISKMSSANLALSKRRRRNSAQIITKCPDFQNVQGHKMCWFGHFKCSVSVRAWVNICSASHFSPHPPTNWQPLSSSSSTRQTSNIRDLQKTRSLARKKSS